MIKVSVDGHQRKYWVFYEYYICTEIKKSYQNLSVLPPVLSRLQGAGKIFAEYASMELILCCALFFSRGNIP